MSDPLKPSTGLLVKLGSLIVHLEELNSPKGHAFDRHAIEAIQRDVEVQAWFKAMQKLALLPVKR